MKHLGFTIQFLVLLVAIPLLMYAGLFHDNKEKSVQNHVENEVSFSKTSTSKSISVDALHFHLITN